MNKLNHLAIIMDGNGRWAKQKGMLRAFGHEKGANVVERVCRVCIQNNIPNLTLYAFSTENWSRPKNEVNFLINLFKKFLKEKEAIILKENIKFKAIGDIDIFDDELKEKILNLENLSKNNSKLNLALAVNYGSKNEIVRACRALLKENQDINEENINLHLDTYDMGDVDLLIRTGGEQRLSNFLLWQASYAELYFTKTLWPDFDSVELQNIMDNYKKIKRKFGGL
ncbi:undecaprenyl diphosphate synthetase [Campylobacter blaseri]|uniref:Isoprenyl transferase n=1 Tax=Campylobacter blaseri TaxID=2042961 RepID=A0A2P8R2B6_9BACT|nr:polyprenyl diphosphate synthase [Campylobacter blaseri]PSM52646.1 di-trans,poly-cis-decaprenylcistransferase [Campylobacter blaseri]PSM54294.1 di-trans,poly-cis-decaprenylcistransferase [Campylobacter blaseri]QKF85945.1 undecaprenyl diphosphate synthetase [Campylobacter blaseri]